MKLLFTAMFILFYANVFAQDTTTIYRGTDSSYTLITVMPQYPGGDKAMFKFLKKNIKCPKEFKNSTVYVSFYIDEEGNLKDEWIILGVSPEVDAEVLRVIKLMPKWTPEYINGNPVRTKYKISYIL